MGHLIGPGSSVDPPKERWWADGTRMCHICMSFSTLVLITPKKSWKHASSARRPQYIARIRAKERTLLSWDDDMMRRVEKRKGNCILLKRTGPRVGPTPAFVETSSFPQERDYLLSQRPLDNVLYSCGFFKERTKKAWPLMKLASWARFPYISQGLFRGRRSHNLPV